MALSRRSGGIKEHDRIGAGPQRRFLSRRLLLQPWTYRARPHLRSDARGREDAQALAEGELPCSRQVPRGWTSRGPPSVSDRRWCRLGRQRRLLNRLWLLTLGSRARPVAEPVHREAGSPCKSTVTEFTHPTGVRLHETTGGHAAPASPPTEEESAVEHRIGCLHGADSVDRRPTLTSS